MARRRAAMVAIAASMLACGTVLTFDVDGGGGGGGTEGGGGDGGANDFDGGDFDGSPPVSTGCTLRFEPPIVDVGQIPLNGTASVLVTLLNSGTETVTFSSASLAGVFQLSPPTLPTPLGPGQSETFNVSVPASATPVRASLSGSITLTSERCSGLTLPMKGEVVETGYAFSGPVAFGNVRCGDTPLKDATITTASALVSMAAWQVTAPPRAPFVIENLTMGTVKPGTPAVFNVRLQAVHTPGPVTTTMSVNVTPNDAGEPPAQHTFPISAHLTGGTITFSKTTLQLQQGGPPQIVLATNTGNDSVSVAFAAADPGYSVTPATHDLKVNEKVQLVVQNISQKGASTSTLSAKASTTPPLLPGAFCASGTVTLQPLPAF